MAGHGIEDERFQFAHIAGKVVRLKQLEYGARHDRRP